MLTGFRFHSGIAGQLDPAQTRSAPLLATDRDGFIDPHTGTAVQRTYLGIGRTCRGAQGQRGAGNGGVHFFSVILRYGFPDRFDGCIVRQQHPAQFHPAPGLSVDFLQFQDLHNTSLICSTHFGTGRRSGNADIDAGSQCHGGIGLLHRGDHRDRTGLGVTAVDTYTLLLTLLINGRCRYGFPISKAVFQFRRFPFFIMITVDTFPALQPSLLGGCGPIHIPVAKFMAQGIDHLGFIMVALFAIPTQLAFCIAAGSYFFIPIAEAMARSGNNQTLKHGAVLAIPASITGGLTAGSFADIPFTKLMLFAGFRGPGLAEAAQRTIPVLLAAFCAGGCLSDLPLTEVMAAKRTLADLEMITAGAIPALLAVGNAVTKLLHIPIAEGMLVCRRLHFHGGVAGQPDPAQARSAPLVTVDRGDFIEPHTGAVVQCTKFYIGRTCRGPQSQRIAGKGGIGLFSVIRHQGFTDRFDGCIARQQHPAQLHPAPGLSVDFLQLQEFHGLSTEHGAHFGTGGRCIRADIDFRMGHCGINLFHGGDHRNRTAFFIATVYAAMFFQAFTIHSGSGYGLPFAIAVILLRDRVILTVIALVASAPLYTFFRTGGMMQNLPLAHTVAGSFDGTAFKICAFAAVQSLLTRGIAASRYKHLPLTKGVFSQCGFPLLLMVTNLTFPLLPTGCGAGRLLQKLPFAEGMITDGDLPGFEMLAIFAIPTLLTCYRAAGFQRSIPLTEAVFLHRNRSGLHQVTMLAISLLLTFCGTGGFQGHIPLGENVLGNLQHRRLIMITVFTITALFALCCIGRLHGHIPLAKAMAGSRGFSGFCMIADCASLLLLTGGLTAGRYRLRPFAHSMAHGGDLSAQSMVAGGAGLLLLTGGLTTRRYGLVPFAHSMAQSGDLFGLCIAAGSAGLLLLTGVLTTRRYGLMPFSVAMAGGRNDLAEMLVTIFTGLPQFTVLGTGGIRTGDPLAVGVILVIRKLAAIIVSIAVQEDPAQLATAPGLTVDKINGNDLYLIILNDLLNVAVMGAGACTHIDGVVFHRRYKAVGQHPIIMH